MRAIAVFAGVLLVILATVWFLERDMRRQRRATPPNVEDAARMALLMARHLDRALADPMYRQSTEWEEQAAALVTNFYGKELQG